MKRKILASILGVAAMVAASSSYGQGKLNLNNYSGTGGQVLYGGGAKQIAGTTAGAGVVNGTPASSTWNIGFYYALGDVTASVNADATGIADPSSLGGGLAFATGAAGDTTTIKALPGGGYFTSTSDAIINGWTAGSITVEVVAYTGADYGSSAQRGHSTAFLFTPIASTAPQGAPAISTSTGGMPAFSVFAVPEPSTFALAGLGAAALMAFRRKKQA